MKSYSNKTRKTMNSKKNKPKDGEFKTKVSVFSFHTATVLTTRPELTPIK